MPPSNIAAPTDTVVSGCPPALAASWEQDDADQARAARIVGVCRGDGHDDAYYRLPEESDPATEATRRAASHAWTAAVKPVLRRMCYDGASSTQLESMQWFKLQGLRETTREVRVINANATYSRDALHRTLLDLRVCAEDTLAQRVTKTKKTKAAAAPPPAGVPEPAPSVAVAAIGALPDTKQVLDAWLTGTLPSGSAPASHTDPRLEQAFHVPAPFCDDDRIAFDAVVRSVRCVKAPQVVVTGADGSSRTGTIGDLREMRTGHVSMSWRVTDEFMGTPTATVLDIDDLLRGHVGVGAVCGPGASDTRRLLRVCFQQNGTDSALASALSRDNAWHASHGWHRRGGDVPRFAAANRFTARDIPLLPHDTETLGLSYLAPLISRIEVTVTVSELVDHGLPRSVACTYTIETTVGVIPDMVGSAPMGSSFRAVVGPRHVGRFEDPRFDTPLLLSTRGSPLFAMIDGEGRQPCCPHQMDTGNHSVYFPENGTLYSFTMQERHAQNSTTYGGDRGTEVGENHSTQNPHLAPASRITVTLGDPVLSSIHDEHDGVPVAAQAKTFRANKGCEQKRQASVLGATRDGHGTYDRRCLSVSTNKKFSRTPIGLLFMCMWPYAHIVRAEAAHRTGDVSRTPELMSPDSDLNLDEEIPLHELIGVIRELCFLGPLQTRGDTPPDAAVGPRAKGAPGDERAYTGIDPLRVVSATSDRTQSEMRADIASVFQCTETETTRLWQNKGIRTRRAALLLFAQKFVCTASSKKQQAQQATATASVVAVVPQTAGDVSETSRQSSTSAQRAMAISARDDEQQLLRLALQTIDNELLPHSSCGLGFACTEATGCLHCGRAGKRKGTLAEIGRIAFNVMGLAINSRSGTSMYSIPLRRLDTPGMQYVRWVRDSSRQMWQKASMNNETMLRNLIAAVPPPDVSTIIRRASHVPDERTVYPTPPAQHTAWSMQEQWWWAHTDDLDACCPLLPLVAAAVHNVRDVVGEQLHAQLSQRAKLPGAAAPLWRRPWTSAAVGRPIPTGLDFGDTTSTDMTSQSRTYCSCATADHIRATESVSRVRVVAVERKTPEHKDQQTLAEARERNLGMHAVGPLTITDSPLGGASHDARFAAHGSSKQGYSQTSAATQSRVADATGPLGDTSEEDSAPRFAGAFVGERGQGYPRASVPGSLQRDVLDAIAPPPTDGDAACGGWCAHCGQLWQIFRLRERADRIANALLLLPRYVHRNIALSPVTPSPIGPCWNPFPTLVKKKKAMARRVGGSVPNGAVAICVAAQSNALYQRDAVRDLMRLPAFEMAMPSCAIETLSNDNAGIWIWASYRGWTQAARLLVAALRNRSITAVPLPLGPADGEPNHGEAAGATANKRARRPAPSTAAKRGTVVPETTTDIPSDHTVPRGILQRTILGYQLLFGGGTPDERVPLPRTDPLAWPPVDVDAQPTLPQATVLALLSGTTGAPPPPVAAMTTTSGRHAHLQALPRNVWGGSTVPPGACVGVAGRSGSSGPLTDPTDRAQVEAWANDAEGMAGFTFVDAGMFPFTAGWGHAQRAQAVNLASAFPRAFATDSLEEERRVGTPYGPAVSNGGGLTANNVVFGSGDRMLLAATAHARGSTGATAAQGDAPATAARGSPLAHHASLMPAPGCQAGVAAVGAAAGVPGGAGNATAQSGQLAAAARKRNFHNYHSGKPTDNNNGTRKQRPRENFAALACWRDPKSLSNQESLASKINRIVNRRSRDHGSRCVQKLYEEIICLSESPDGDTAGLLQHKTMGARVSMHVGWRRALDAGVLMYTTSGARCMAQSFLNGVDRLITTSHTGGATPVAVTVASALHQAYTHAASAVIVNGAVAGLLPKLEDDSAAAQSTDGAVAAYCKRLHRGFEAASQVREARRLTTRLALQEHSSEAVTDARLPVWSLPEAGCVPGGLGGAKVLCTATTVGATAHSLSVWFDLAAGELGMSTEPGRFMRPVLVATPATTLGDAGDVSQTNAARLGRNAVPTHGMVLDVIDPTEVGCTGVANVCDALVGAKHTVGPDWTLMCRDAMARAEAAGDEATVARLAGLLWSDTATMDEYVRLSGYCLFGSTSCQVPFASNNAGPRLMYQSAITKNSVGGSNDLNQNGGWSLVYGETALASTIGTRSSRTLGRGGGMNLSMALCAGIPRCSTVEDACGIKQKVLDCGAYAICHSFTVDVFAVTTRGERFARPDAVGAMPSLGDPCGIFTPEAYGHLQDDGSPRPGTFIRGGDPVAGIVRAGHALGWWRMRVRCAKTNAWTMEWVPASELPHPPVFPCAVDISPTMPLNLYGQVTRIVDIASATAGMQIKRIFFIRETGAPGHGDKFCSRHGQKAILGHVARSCDAPRDASGRSPDIFINTHGIISRMTLGQVMEGHYNIMQLADRRAGARARDAVSAYLVPDPRVCEEMLREESKQACETIGRLRSRETTFRYRPTAVPPPPCVHRADNGADLMRRAEWCGETGAPLGDGLPWPPPSANEIVALLHAVADTVASGAQMPARTIADSYDEDFPITTDDDEDDVTDLVAAGVDLAALLRVDNVGSQCSVAPTLYTALTQVAAFKLQSRGAKPNEPNGASALSTEESGRGDRNSGSANMAATNAGAQVWPCPADAHPGSKLPHQNGLQALRGAGQPPPPPAAGPAASASRNLAGAALVTGAPGLVGGAVAEQHRTRHLARAATEALGRVVAMPQTKARMGGPHTRAAQPASVVPAPSFVLGKVPHGAAASTSANVERGHGGGGPPDDTVGAGNVVPRAPRPSKRKTTITTTTV